MPLPSQNHFKHCSYDYKNCISNCFMQILMFKLWKILKKLPSRTIFSKFWGITNSDIKICYLNNYYRLPSNQIKYSIDQSENYNLNWNPTLNQHEVPSRSYVHYSYNTKERKIALKLCHWKRLNLSLLCINWLSGDN